MNAHQEDYTVVHFNIQELKNMLQLCEMIPLTDSNKAVGQVHFEYGNGKVTITGMDYKNHKEEHIPLSMSYYQYTVEKPASYKDDGNVTHSSEKLLTMLRSKSARAEAEQVRDELFKDKSDPGYQLAGLSGK